ncbi:hypothetical protein IW140_004626 [Coemansia sp. RSA 1813]|nr:hypothetical protein EV178_002138 [Coemansia sp. RSA 1646]KAJ1767703.1 hypothetical protein LPJ74_005223 [Coemansia sp. RSA 1843]KAJ2090362.1 hypothetical protein IW138_002788 [Coemansia sp. RSA 986]KAJ2215548.1 hypothetical protein EV179_002141 [Coemansia sp. RSA 487]KAJ2567201.1 hypothetical protein IW140_004626 [Coemansia sp. RSA 1813]
MVVTAADYAHSDEEIDIEMFDSDVELSKVTRTSQSPKITYESDSDFEDHKPKRGTSVKRSSTRGRGRGRGRGGVSSSAAKRKAADATTDENVAEDEFDIQSTPKPRRGRPPREGKPAASKPKAGRGRKKTTVSRDISDDEDDGDYSLSARAATKRSAGAKGKARQTTLDDISLPIKEPVYDPAKTKALAEQYPDHYWNQLVAPKATSDRIDLIDEENQLELLPYNISDQMAMTGISISPDGTMLATFGSTGQVNVWDTETFECLTSLRDMSEPNIDEFFVGQFTPNSEYLIVGGKLKDRKRWSEADEDNHILPCPLKIFNVLTGEVVARLEGHSEEILCLKSVVYNGENYYVTTSQDGYIRRWHMDSDWVVLLDSKEVEDGVTCMAFTVSFVPNTGNRFFVASTDDHVTLMDLERCAIVQRFDPIYSSYCDCGKFVELVEQPVVQEIQPAASTSGDASDNADAAAGEGSSDPASDNTVPAASTFATEPSTPYAYFITRGVELLDAENNTVSSRPNTCTLHRLVYPTDPDGKFELQEIRRYYHDEYLSNSWLIRITSNGRYLLAPTLNGQVFVFSIATGHVTGILRDHDTIEVRDCKFHPTKNLLFTCSDDGTVKVYRSVFKPKQQQKEEDTCANLAAPNEVEAVGVDGADGQQKALQDSVEPESPQTVAVSPLASLKEGIETLAVREVDEVHGKDVAESS